MTIGFETQNLVRQNPAVSQPVQGPEAFSPGRAARVSTAPSSIAAGATNAHLGVDSLNRGREDLRGHSALGIDPGLQRGVLLDDDFGQTATTRAAAAAVERFPFTTVDVQARLTEVRELQQGLSEEAGSVNTPRNLVSIDGERIYNNDLAASITVPAELRGLVEVDLPSNAPGTVLMEDGKTYMRADDYYLQVAQARHEDLAAQEAQLVQQLHSDPTTQRALVERQSLSAQGRFDYLIGRIAGTGAIRRRHPSPGRSSQDRQGGAVVDDRPGRREDNRHGFGIERGVPGSRRRSPASRRQQHCRPFCSTRPWSTTSE